MRKKYLYSTFLLFLTITGVIIYFWKINTPSHVLNSSRVLIHIGDTEVNAEVVSSDEKRSRGLSGRDGLGKNQGMLFIFPNKDRYGFWMKEMKFPIDIVWIDTQYVVYIKEHAPIPIPGYELPIYFPNQTANLVLEVPAGYTREHGITIGTKVEISK